MCGIVACHTSRAALDYIVPALERLEYRGYDSSGVAVTSADGSLALLRSVGKLSSLKKLLADYQGPALNGTGIGHTRWATHGGVSEQNAHPHLACGDEVAIVHNGIIDNASELRTELEALGHSFRSDVDSEVITHLIEDEIRAGVDLLEAVRAAVSRLSGTWALAAMQRGSDRIVVTAHECPLVVARSKHGHFAASDMSALLDWVDDVHVLRDGDIVELGGAGVGAFESAGLESAGLESASLESAGLESSGLESGGVESGGAESGGAELVGARSGGVELVGPWRWSGPEGPRTAPAAFTPRWRPEDVTLGAHRDFMAKEIGEQSTVAARIVDEYADGIVDGSLWRGLGLPALERVRVLGCGTSLYAGMVVACALRTVGALPVRTVVASEAGDDLVEPGTITLAISQSGETADVLRALERRAGGPVLAMTTNVHSTLFRTADAAVDCLSGPEIGVAATKTFTAQVLTGVALTLSGLVFSGRLEPERARRIVALLADMPQRLAAANDIAAQVIPDVVGSLTEAPGFLFLGRGSSLPYAAEGALKLQEITYRWAHAYPAGELKHGPIALIEEGTPVIAIDDGNPRLRANLSEVAARGARVIEIGGPQSTLPLLETTYASPPWGPLEAVVGLQQLARSLAIALGRDVDKPRNLAKSVTVE